MAGYSSYLLTKMDNIWSTLRWVAMEVIFTVWEEVCKTAIPIFLVLEVATLLLLQVVSTAMAMVIYLLTVTRLMVQYDFFNFFSFFSLAHIFRNPRTCDVYPIDRLFYHLFIINVRARQIHHLLALLNLILSINFSFLNNKRLISLLIILIKVEMKRCYY